MRGARPTVGTLHRSAQREGAPSSTVPTDARDALGGLAERARCGTQPAPSPCVSVCRMDDATALCVGCYRTIDEIMAWGRQSDSAHRRVWQQVMLRAGLAPMPPANTRQHP